ncbi:putative tfiih complex helicase protein [Lasiodiplodia theobromae]|uniref:DNA 3'-5' helicase n=2 Tax=Lasiodiplodia TaxID=66739 RepID=A0A5N5DJV7_9PEZI|nr:DNA repair helicase Rad25 [Lasiodiplodia theobromae]KAB2578186.1 putative DNA repair helicase ercc3 [Lasiodiplodia theobromae]KAF4544212.1 DNA repair helicase Rad25 [Lasiodiplodia theobromae]KAF9641298.1 putative tfiih complex helicase protein [Lasiodiplodia theobromae]KAK0637784.1 putative DNA repair helicase ercc3 [Lasiodiplodia hormozganensis]
MAAKRKATAPTGGSSKRVASGVNTPISIASSDDEYTEPTADEVAEQEEMRMLVERFQRSKKVAAPGFRRSDALSSHFHGHDYSSLDLKKEHTDRPLWVTPEGKIILESFSPYFKTAERFLINIAEPQSRVSLMHEYSLTANSLFAAVSVGLSTDEIINQLEKLSKTPLDDEVKDFIIQSTKSFGKVRLVLKQTKYFVESSDPDILRTLLRDSIIGPCRIDNTEGLMKTTAAKKGDLVIPGTNMAAGAKQAAQAQPQPEDADQMMNVLREEDDDEEEDQVHSFQIDGPSVQTVSKRCRAIGLPLTEEYDFRNDFANANLEIDIRPGVEIRPYQEQALTKMFGNGRARSGIIVLPCGAGKTLVGITAACTVRKGCIVLCTSTMSVLQWRDEFIKWSNINPSDIAVFTAEQKDFFSGNTGVLISTYNMIAMNRTRSYDSQKVMDFITQREWGLMVLDEVHVVPAEMFSRVTHAVPSHAKLGLTATLLREDDKIVDLNFLIGPKLYEANWQELSENGFIAKVICSEVWCQMTTEFYAEYLKAKTVNKKSLLYTMNPRKFQAAQFLIDYHEKRGDKTIVFSDNVYALKAYARRLNKAFIYGGTSNQERQTVLQNFMYNEDVKTIFLSKIGDTSLDLPEATCLIQISSHYGSRRQEAQRLGRILRAKRRNDEGFNAFFYSLVSKDTTEMFYSSKRQAFLVDQGYSFRVITRLQGIENLPGLVYATPQERRELLTDVMLQNDVAGEVEKNDGDLFDRKHGNRFKKGVRRTAGTLSELSGGQDMAYMEYNRDKNKELRASGNQTLKKLKRSLGKQNKRALPM